MTLSFLPQTGLVFMLIFARIGTMLMLLPVLGEAFVPSRVRLMMGLLFALVMLPVIREQYGVLPDTIFGAIALLGGEMVVGFFIGATARLIMSATHVAGTVIAFQTGLAFAQSNDFVQGIQGAIIGSFLSMVAITLIFVLDLHYLLISAMYDSYKLFKPGAALPLGDFSIMAINTVSSSFKVGIQLSAPFLVFGLIFYFGIGILSRLMPQIQIFFVAMPANIALGLLLFMFLISVMSMWFVEHFVTIISQFTG